jgi:drug/metabolite transporter (DMT)-like permease
MAVALALLAAVLWGSGDFLGGTASRRAPVLAVLAASQFIGLLGVAVWLVAAGDATPPRADLLAAVGAGAALYGGLSIGAMTIVAPVSTLSPVVPLFADLVQGNRPGAIALVGIVIALSGVVILSREPGRTPGRRFATGLGLALVAAGGFGFFMVGLDAASDASPAWGTTVARLTSTVLALTAALVLRAPFGRLRGLVPMVVAIGVFDTGANVLIAIASTSGLIGVIATLSALYPLATVMLAVLVAGERPSHTRLAGGGLALAGAALIAVG